MCLQRKLRQWMLLLNRHVSRKGRFQQLQGRFRNVLELTDGFQTSGSFAAPQVVRGWALSSGTVVSPLLSNEESRKKSWGYPSSFPDDSRPEITALNCSPCTAKFWGGTDQSIIGDGDMSYTRSDGKLVEYFNVGLARQKNYISVYIHGVEDGKYLAETYGPAIGKVKVGQSSISFKKTDDIRLYASSNS